MRSNTSAGAAPEGGSYGIGRGGLDGRAVLAWLVVGLPLAWGVYKTLVTASKMFH